MVFNRFFDRYGDLGRLDLLFARLCCTCAFSFGSFSAWGNVWSLGGIDKLRIYIFPFRFGNRKCIEKQFRGEMNDGLWGLFGGLDVALMAHLTTVIDQRFGR